MADIEKVIKGLENCITGFDCPPECPYLDDCNDLMKPMFVELAKDALVLLKEQEAVEPKQGEWIYCEDASGQDGYKCSECGFFEPWYYGFENHNFITEYAYCPSCGKPIQEGR